jgi:hypothetical protein
MLREHVPVMRKGRHIEKEIGPAEQRSAPSHVQKEPQVSAKKIGLVCNGRGPSEDAVKYALNACESLGAHLDILHFSSSIAEHDHLHRLISRVTAHGVAFRLLPKPGDDRDERKEMLSYAKGSSDILFVVIDETSWKGITPSGSGRGRTAPTWDSRCPLVVISEQTREPKRGG